LHNKNSCKKTKY